MHVGLFHTRAGFRHAGGKAIFVRKLATALARDHEATLYTRLESDSEVAQRLEDAGVRLVALPDPPRVAERLVERLLPLKADPLVPLTHSLTAGVLADIDAETDVLLTHRFLEDLVLSNLVDVPVAYQYHNVQSVGTGAKLRERFSKASLHLANSEAIASEVEQHFGRSVDGIVSPGVDTDLFSPDAAAEGALAGDGGHADGSHTDHVHLDHADDAEDGPTVLFVGRIVESKGVFDLLDALARIDVTPTVRFVGDGDIDAARARAEALGIAESIHFLGERDHEHLPAYYASADVFCNPTHYEGFGMTNVEAMACGTAVVTTDLPGITEYATDGENAVLVPPQSPEALADALDSMLAAPARRDRLARAARETAEQYDWHAQAERLVGTVSESGL